MIIILMMLICEFILAISLYQKQQKGEPIEYNLVLVNLIMIILLLTMYGMLAYKEMVK